MRRIVSDWVDVACRNTEADGSFELRLPDRSAATARSPLSSVRPSDVPQVRVADCAASALARKRVTRSATEQGDFEFSRAAGCTFVPRAVSTLVQ